jgi:CelD/BcsL family acetyltransferase involved in cellulose biosynthesis
MAAILSVFTPVLDFVLRDRGDSDKSAAVGRACNTLIADLRGEATAVEALYEYLRSKGGQVDPKVNEFNTAWGAARDGQAKLVTAYDEYAKTGRRLPTEPETVPRGEGVEVLGRSLADLNGGDPGDVDDAYSALPDWAAKLNNTGNEVSDACAG